MHKYKYWVVYAFVQTNSTLTIEQWKSSVGKKESNFENQAQKMIFSSL